MLGLFDIDKKENETIEVTSVEWDSDNTSLFWTISHVWMPENQMNLMTRLQNITTLVESSDTVWSTGGLSSKPHQYSCCMNTMKRQKDMILEDEPPKLEGVQYATGEEKRTISNSSRKN